MVCDLTCPKCGGTIEYEECVDTQFWDNTYYDTVIGECQKCKEKYLWAEVYRYHHTEDLRRLADN